MLSELKQNKQKRNKANNNKKRSGSKDCRKYLMYFFPSGSGILQTVFSIGVKIR